MSNRTKRLSRLGNAVVPQVAEHIGRVLLAYAERPSNP
jgi:site-specific DNA-cytosine methylase